MAGDVAWASIDSGAISGMRLVHLMAGVVATLFGLVWAVHVAGILTALSGLLAWVQMSETLPRVPMRDCQCSTRTPSATRDSAAPQTR